MEKHRNITKWKAIEFFVKYQRNSSGFLNINQNKYKIWNIVTITDIKTYGTPVSPGCESVKETLHLFVLFLMFNLSMYLFTGNCPHKRISILILTDSVIIHIRYIFPILDIKSKYYKWNVAKLSIRKGRRKRGTKDQENFFKWKNEMKIFHLTSTKSFWC